MPTDTFNIAITTDDQWVGRSSPTYPPPTDNTLESTQPSIQVDRSLNTGTYEVYNALFRFNTASIPDGNEVSAAILRLQVTSKSSADSLAICGDWHPWTTAAFSDFSHSPASTALVAVDITSSVVVGQNDFALQGLSNISKTGYTGIRLHVTQRASDAAPTGLNRVFIADFSHTTQTEAQLIVTHDVAGELVGMAAI